ncbi:MAG TPA: hypothetical protein VMT34_13910, partial [Aggregatilineales bacterium]|nr:hypothetical protein [Aggregatilineales bacterium]
EPDKRRVGFTQRWSEATRVEPAEGDATAAEALTDVSATPEALQDTAANFVEPVTDEAGEAPTES